MKVFTLKPSPIFRQSVGIVPQGKKRTSGSAEEKGSGPTFVGGEYNGCFHHCSADEFFEFSLRFVL